MRTLIRPMLATLFALLLVLTTAGPARATNPRPPKTLQTPGIDAHLGYIAQHTCTPSAKPGTTALLKALIKTWGGSSWGISRFCSSGGTSEHKEGRALDWHMDSRKAKDRAKVADVVTWITANNGEVAYRLGVMYIIWNQRIWSIYYQELGWRKMADRGSWTANHKDHVHISLSWDGAMAQTSWWTGKVLQVPQLGPCGKSGRPACLPTIGRSSVKSFAHVTVGPFSPYPSVVPAIAGSARVGLTLKAVAGTWMPAGSALSYQWLRDGKAISGATGTEYLVGAADLKHALKVRVSASLGGTTISKTSDETTDTVVGVFAAAKPVVKGNFVVGSTLTGTPGSYPLGTALSYRWQRNGANISGATAPTYRTTPADVGKELRFRVRATKSGYTSAYSYSSAKKVTALLFTTAPQPSIDGILRVGGVLTAVPGTWDPTATFSYRWYRGGKRVDGRTSSTYTLTSKDLGYGISVRVLGTRAGYESTRRYSIRSEKVRAGLTSAAVTMSDLSPRVGQRLKATTATWEPSGVALAYQWYRGGTPISGATERSYLVRADDHGSTLRVRVTGSKNGYPSVTRQRTATSKVANGQFKAGTVTVSGTPAIAQTLIANEGTWKSAVNAALTLSPDFSYQWYASGKAINGATQRTLTLGATLKDAKVHVVVTARSNHYTTTAKASAAVRVG